MQRLMEVLVAESQAQASTRMHSEVPREILADPCQKQPPGRGHFLQGAVLSLSACHRWLCLAEIEHCCPKSPWFLRKGLFDPPLLTWQNPGGKL